MIEDESSGVEVALQDDLKGFAEVGLSPERVAGFEEYRFEFDDRPPWFQRSLRSGLVLDLSTDWDGCGPAGDLQAAGEDDRIGVDEVGGGEAKPFCVFYGQGGLGGAGIDGAGQVDLGAALGLESDLQGRDVLIAICEGPAWHWSGELAQDVGCAGHMEEHNLRGPVAELFRIDRSRPPG